MRYLMPNHPCDFEVPDDWLTEAGLNNFMPISPAYRSSDDAVLIPLNDVEPPCRVPAHSKDWRGFSRTRFISLLQGFVAGMEIEPVPLLELPSVELPPFRPYPYRVNNGFHRFNASVAAGFTLLPSTILSKSD